MLSKTFNSKIFSDDPQSIISSLDEDLSDDDEVYHDTRHTNFNLAQGDKARISSKKIVIKRKDSNFRSLIFGRKSTMKK